MFSGGGLVGGGQHHGIELLKIKSALAMPARCYHLLTLRYCHLSSAAGILGCRKFRPEGLLRKKLIETLDFSLVGPPASWKEEV